MIDVYRVHFPKMKLVGVTKTYWQSIQWEMEFLGELAVAL